MKKLLPILLLLLTACTNQPQACFENTCLDLEIAETTEQKQIGLMNRESLPENSGMLFSYEEEGYYSFWMKNTLIPLDMIWLDEDLEVVHIEHATPCQTEECPSYTSPLPSKYILETNIDFTEENQTKIGDQFLISDF
ncbi:MAG: DUF192 domain-containing protein [Patescibacteria group bacterium]|nr:DUF192 domain-containing protein [Patescibacteria group bacterium]